MTEILTGRYSDHGLHPGDVVEFVAGGLCPRIYPPGTRRTLIYYNSDSVIDSNRNNGLDARYFVVASETKEVKVSKFANFIRKLDGLPPVEDKLSLSSRTWEYPEDFPTEVNPAYIQDFLETRDPDLIDEVFMWDETPQGYDYWSEITNGTREITEEDISYIQWVYDYA